VNAFTLDDLHGAAVFHRNKDGSLLRLLRRKLFNERARKNIAVVFPVCAHDIRLALTHANWLQRIARPAWQHKAVVAYDRQTPVVLVNQFEAMLKTCFAEVTSFCYHAAPIPGWPMAANWMFQNVANHMSTQEHSWMLVEPDAVVLRADWLDLIQDEYERCGKNFMGPHVKGMAHCNGGAIYAADTPTRLPRAMSAVEQAWDYICAPDMMPDCHDASHLMQHIWTIFNDEASEVGGGQVPAEVTVERARRWIRPGAVMIHRIKDDSLIKLLISGEYRP